MSPASQHYPWSCPPPAECGTKILVACAAHDQCLMPGRVADSTHVCHGCQQNIHGICGVSSDEETFSIKYSQLCYTCLGRKHAALTEFSTHQRPGANLVMPTKEKRAPYCSVIPATLPGAASYQGPPVQVSKTLAGEPDFTEEPKPQANSMNVQGPSPHIISKHHLGTHGKIKSDNAKGPLTHLFSTNQAVVNLKIKELNEMKKEVTTWAREAVKAIMIKEARHQKVTYNGDVV